jgi:hypothetical protein
VIPQVVCPAVETPQRVEMFRDALRSLLDRADRLPADLASLRSQAMDVCKQLSDSERADVVLGMVSLRAESPWSDAEFAERLVRVCGR